MSKVFKMNNRIGNESLSMKSKSLSKISDNNSEGSFIQNTSNDQHQGNMSMMKKKKKNNNMIQVNMKKGPLATQHPGYFADLKNENNYKQSFNSDADDNTAQSMKAMLNKSFLNPVNNSFLYNPNSSLPPIFNPI